MDALVAIFGSYAKVKILRLFLFNEDTAFLTREIAKRTKCSLVAIKKELTFLVNAGVIKKKMIVKEMNITSKSGTSIKKLKGPGYSLNERFLLKDALKVLLTVASIKADETLVKAFVGSGKIKLLIATGVFIQNWDSRVDLFIVGDGLDLTKIERVIGALEVDIGKEIAYSAFETADFEYRIGIHDRLVRDILDYPHVTLVDKLDLEMK